MFEVSKRWDVASMIEGLRRAADSPKDQVAITRQRLVEAADLIEELVDRFAQMQEPEWDYGYVLLEPEDGEEYDGDAGYDTSKDALEAGRSHAKKQDQGYLPALLVQVRRRRKAGPWEPVA